MSWKDDLDSKEQEHIEEVLELIRIPSVSTSPEHQPDMERTAKWVVNRMKRAGIPEVRLAPSAGHPAVIGRWHVSDEQPTILIYGHYDVQPEEPVDLWNTPPFEPTIDGDRIYGRGSSDMKGSLLTAIQGVEASAKANGGKPPINVSFIIEGEEEIGSPNLVQVLRENQDMLAADVIINADGGQYSQETPSMSIGLKGIVGMQVNLTTANSDLHSGEYGAYVPNAVQVLTKLAATFHDADGKVMVEGFYDNVREFSEQDREEIAQLAVDAETVKKDVGVKDFFGEPEYTLRERNWGRPTLDLNGIWGGFQGEGSKTVTPAKAHLKITCRLVADQDPDEVRERVIAHIHKHVGSRAEVDFIFKKGKARAYVFDRSHPVYTAVKETLAELYGTEPVLVRSGGSVPATSLFQDELGLPTITLGWSLPGSNAHAPNEWYTISDHLRGRKAYALLLDKLAK